MNEPNLLVDDPLIDENQFSTKLISLINGILMTIQNPKLSCPVLVSGDWGSGKTSLLKLMQKKILEESKQTIWFEAWHYEKEAGLLPALMRKVWESMPEDYRKKESNKKGWLRVMECAAITATNAMPELAKAFGVPLSGLFGIVPGTLKHLDALKSHETIEPPTDSVMEIRERFSALIKEAWGENTRLTIFIDDLDRCSPEGSVAMLDAIRMLVTASGDIRCRFVVALDRKIITQAITAKFEGINAFDGNRYLEKIFPIEFHVPSPSVDEAAVMIKKFLEEIGNGEAGLDRDSQDALTIALAEPAFANPRLMKRSINRFQLLRFFEEKSQNRKPEQDKMLTKWIAATDRWPSLRRIMQQHGDRYWREIAQAIESHDAGRFPGPEAKKLSAESGALAWMRKENIFDSDILANFRKVEERLYRFGL